MTQQNNDRGSPAAAQGRSAPSEKRRPGWRVAALLAVAAVAATAVAGSRLGIKLPGLTAPAPHGPAVTVRPAGAPAAPPRTEWVASAPGRVEPRSGEIRVGAQMLGRIAQVLVRLNDEVGEGDLLIRLDDEELAARLAAAEADVAAKKRDRDDVSVSGSAEDRRRLEDNVWTAERAAIAARRDLDRLVAAARNGSASAEEVGKARTALKAARDRLDGRRQELARLKGNITKAPGRADTVVILARAEHAAAEAAHEKTRIRAPVAGTVLLLPARVGETAAPAADRALVVLGDITALRVRADLDERNAAKVVSGQKVLVRAEAYPGQFFEGSVAMIASALAPGQTVTPGRRRPNEAGVLDITIDLVPGSPLLTGMQVDAFFLALPQDDAKAGTTAAK